MVLPNENDKALLLRILQDQPDSSSFDELLRVLAFHRLITRGRQDVAQERLVETDALKERMKSWRA